MMLKNNVINEVVKGDAALEILHWAPVVVKDYGSEGCAPVRRSDCLLTDEHISCVGSSGNNLCSHYMGHLASHADGNIIRCSLIWNRET